ncbi:unnamed protein product [Brassica oleracea var. botrytis]
MASQWTIQKLVTWRVKDWATCFLASKIPIDIDEDGVNNTGNTMNNNNVMFKRTKRKMKSKKKRSESKLSLSPPGTRHHNLRSSRHRPQTNLASLSSASTVMTVGLKLSKRGKKRGRRWNCPRKSHQGQ